MKRFSERNNHVEINFEPQLDWIDEPLKNAIWNILFEDFLKYISDDTGEQFSKSESNFSKVAKYIWKEFYKKPIDTLETGAYYNFTEIKKYPFISRIRLWYFGAEWYEIYDFVEFICTSFSVSKEFVSELNRVLQRELSAYRIIDGLITPISNKEEINQINDSLENIKSIKTVNEHLRTALKHLSDRTKPDYRNSIKESVSAVEAVCILITNNDKATLGKALKEIEKKYNLHGSLKTAFSALYGYTSDSGGIRHALIEENQTVGFDEAKFMYISCLSFVNYLISKLK